MTNMFRWQVDQRIEKIKEEYVHGKIKPEKSVVLVNIFEGTHSLICSKDWGFKLISLSRTDKNFELAKVSYEEFRDSPILTGKPTVFAFVGYGEVVFYPIPDQNYQLIMESENLPDSWKEEIECLEKMKEESLNNG